MMELLYVKWPFNRTGEPIGPKDPQAPVGRRYMERMEKSFQKSGPIKTTTESNNEFERAKQEISAMDENGPGDLVSF